MVLPARLPRTADTVLRYRLRKSRVFTRGLAQHPCFPHQGLEAAYATAHSSVCRSGAEHWVAPGVVNFTVPACRKGFVDSAFARAIIANIARPKTLGPRVLYLVTERKCVSRGCVFGK
jgi:hypothetical protein